MLIYFLYWQNPHAASCAGYYCGSKFARQYKGLQVNIEACVTAQKVV